ncbi:MAG: Holliday junction branch migration protein RuvA [Clostridia bacterium]|nr:Holliday junction branch migration protein RuvA [Clostridia bacterium]
MYEYLKGKLIETYDSIAVIEVGGVGYKLNVSANATEEFQSKRGEEVLVYCHLCVREDDMSLFGFYSKNERQMFLKLIEISGVGPKLAIAILGGMKLDALAVAIAKEDNKLLAKIKGVGKKTAERIVLELKDKVTVEGEVSINEIETPIVKSNVNEDAVVALMSLGFNRAQAVQAVSAVQTDGMTLEEIVFTALKNA